MDYLDLSQLAQYLHLTPAQIKKMVDRGDLPARKVGGSLRFSEAEVHHWLEEKIGLGDSEELDHVRRVLDAKEEPRQHEPRPLSELCPIELIANPLSARTRSSVIRSMCDLAAKTGMLWDAKAMCEAVTNREQLHPTALDCGIALMHPRRPQTSLLADSVVALGVCPSPIPFSDSGQLTDVFFLLCSYDDSDHLRILAKLSRLITDSEWLDGLRAADSPGDTWAILDEAERELDAMTPS